jgi:hypothetical protein
LDEAGEDLEGGPGEARARVTAPPPTVQDRPAGEADGGEEDQLGRDLAGERATPFA